MQSSEKSRIEHAIDIKGVSKRFRRNAAGGYTTIKSWLLGLFREEDTSSHHITCALDDLTIRIPRGASIGIVGKNGSGKSTLLKLITGIYKPDTGSISLNGRVSALIELGAGFHPDFTGRENLYLGGIIQGLSRKEIDRRFDEIVHFAELEDVIDDPVRTYSSGMFMRLGFSLAVHTDPDILLIDEVLAVGDAGFVSKCKDRIAELRSRGVTLLLVTHDMGAVERWCDEALWLNQGVVMERGEPRRVIDAYIDFTERGEEAELEFQESQKLEAQKEEAEESSPGEKTETAEAQRWGSREVEITAVRLKTNEGEEQLLYHSDQAMNVEIDYVVHDAMPDLAFGIAVHKNDGTMIFGTNTDIEGIDLPELSQKGTFSCRFDRLGFLEGSYHVDVAVHRKDGYAYDYHKHIKTFAVRWSKDQIGLCVPPHSWSLHAGGKSEEWRTHD